MKICQNCGAQCEDSANHCTNCGVALAAEEPVAQTNPTPEQPPVYQQPPVYPQPPMNQPYYGVPAPMPKNPNKGKAIAGMVLGICGLVVPYLGTICAIIGLIISIMALKGYHEGEPGRGMAIAGLVCSIIGLVWAVLLILILAGVASVAASSSYWYLVPVLGL